jgi:hypothetical protein
MINKIQMHFLLVLFAALVFAACSEAPKYAAIENILATSGIPLQKKDKIIVYNDNSCDLCVKNLEYFIDHLPSKEFDLVYTSGSKKVTYENSSARGIVTKDQFRLVNDQSLFDELARTTKDYKGIYLLSVKNNHIDKVEPIDNSQ